MSVEGHESIIVGVFPPGVEVRAHAVKLLRRKQTGELGKDIALEYDWEREIFDLSELMEVADLPWRVGSSQDFSTLIIRNRDVARSLSICEPLVANLDELTEAILKAVPDESIGFDQLREDVEDWISLTSFEHADADARALRVAQVFCAVLRTLRRAARRDRGLVLVHDMREPE